ncbi:MAG TPA: outer membrane lipoprotein-sorting protein [Elusimicrobiota bacterium]|nr:outer membrane lipoprotein-sorting protein [Elusimicrobiota bacterium]
MAVRKVDEIRNPQMDYTLRCHITSFSSKDSSHASSFDVFVKGKDKTFIRQTEPADEKDRLILMRERAVWTYFPSASKPIRVPLQERLTGDIAIGDIARANFTNDYSARFVPPAPGEATSLYKIELLAVMEEVTYARVILWANKSNFRPVKAEYYAVSGRLLKTCTFENYKMLGGAVRPSRLVMVDAVQKDKRSIVDYDQIRLGQLSESLFTKDRLKKIQ